MLQYSGEWRTRDVAEMMKMLENYAVPQAETGHEKHF
jgi:hypothetical protein